MKQNVNEVYQERTFCTYGDCRRYGQCSRALIGCHIQQAKNLGLAIHTFHKVPPCHLKGVTK